MTLACTLGASAAWADEAADPYAGIHTVAIVSALGDVLTLKHDNGFLGSRPPESVLDTRAHLDDFVTAQIAQALAGRFTIVDGAVDPALLSGGALPREVAAKLHPLRAGGTGPDAIVFVHPITVEHQLDQKYFTVRYSISGMSASLTTGWLGNHTILFSTLYEVVAIDAHTGRILGGAKAQSPATGIFGNRAEPVETCDYAFWPQPQDDPSPDQLLQIGAEMHAIVGASLPNALQGAHLTAQGNDIKPKQWDGRPLLCHEMG